MTLKLTLKQLMLIIMSILLVLTVTMSAIVIAKVGDMVQGLGGPSMNQPPVAGTNPSGTEADPTQGTQPDPTGTQAPTRPQETDPNHEHEYVKSQTVAATCTDMGYTIYLCGCGKNDIRDFHDARGHKYGEEEVLKATCEKPGYRQATCLRCGVVDTREVFDALEHDYQLVTEQKLTCVQDGFVEYKCGNCDDIKRENEQKAEGHKWKTPSQEISQPTDIAPGKEKKTCEVCGETETVLTPPTGNVDIQIRSTPSIKNGWTEYVLYVGTQEKPQAYIYSIWIAGDHGNFEAAFSMSGLTVTFDLGTGDDAVSYQHILKPFSSEVLAVDVDGNFTYEIPNLNQDPTEEPTEEPTGEPTGEPTEEPTGEPTEAPTGEPGNE